MVLCDPKMSRCSGGVTVEFSETSDSKNEAFIITYIRVWHRFNNGLKRNKDKCFRVHIRQSRRSFQWNNFNWSTSEFMETWFFFLSP